MPRFGQHSYVAALGVLWLTTAAQAQVDWSELLGEEAGKAAADFPRETVREQPPRIEPAPALPAGYEQRRPRPTRVQPTPAMVRHDGTHKTSRRVANDLPEEDREFPAAPRIRRR